MDESVHFLSEKITYESAEIWFVALRLEQLVQRTQRWFFALECNRSIVWISENRPDEWLTTPHLSNTVAVRVDVLIWYCTLFPNNIRHTLLYISTVFCKHNIASLNVMSKDVASQPPCKWFSKHLRSLKVILLTCKSLLCPDGGHPHPGSDAHEQGFIV